MEIKSKKMRQKNRKKYQLFFRWFQRNLISIKVIHRGSLLTAAVIELPQTGYNQRFSQIFCFGKTTLGKGSKKKTYILSTFCG